LTQLARAFFPDAGLGHASSPPVGPGDAGVDSRVRNVELRYQTLIERLPVITFLASLESDLSEIYVSPHIERVLDYSAKEWIENPVLWYQRLHDEDKQRWNIEFTRTVSFGEDFKGDYRFVAKGGNVVWIRGEIAFVRDAQGRPSFLQGIGYDITELKKAEDVLRRSKVDLEHLVVERSSALMEANESLQREIAARKIAEQLAEQRAREVEAAARVKGEFLANMSHEIRTPMNGIIATADLLNETSLTAEQRDDLDIIVKSGKSLLVVINDILDFTKLEAGKVALEPRAFDLAELTRRIAKLLEPRIVEKDIVYLCEIDERLPAQLVTDETRLGQVLLNVIGNAVKFTPRAGQITVTFRRGQPVGSGMQLTCSVADSGVGIAADKLSDIFQPFSQADTSTTRLFGGTGLGLSISRALVRLLGGELQVESVIGRGTTFHFTIGVEAADTRPTAAPEPADTVQSPLNLRSDIRVLVAEDNTVNATILRRLLKKHGLASDLAVNGREAVDAYAAAADGQEYDLIFMDVQMPELDGFQATSLIREIAQATRKPPCYVVALTAHAMAGDREKCLAAGMDDYMSKPVDRKELDRVLSRWRL
jgi:PAS domain S-box-containing protein